MPDRRPRQVTSARPSNSGDGAPAARSKGAQTRACMLFMTFGLFGCAESMKTQSLPPGHAKPLSENDCVSSAYVGLPDGGSMHCLRACWDVLKCDEDASCRPSCDRASCPSQGVASRLPIDGQCIEAIRQKSGDCPEQSLRWQATLRDVAHCTKDADCARLVKIFGQGCADLGNLLVGCSVEIERCPLGSQPRCRDGVCLGEAFGADAWNGFSIQTKTH